MILIDVERFEVTDGKREFKLTPIQFDLLTILAKANGKVVGYETLQKQLWPDWPAVKVSVNQVVFRLRKSIKDRRGNVIQTVLKRGFKAKGVALSI